MKISDIQSSKLSRVPTGTLSSYVKEADDYVMLKILEQCPSFLNTEEVEIVATAGYNNALTARHITEVTDESGDIINSYSYDETNIVFSSDGTYTVKYVPDSDTLLLPKSFKRFYIDYAKMLEEHDCFESSNMTYESYLSQWTNTYEKMLSTYITDKCKSDAFTLNTCNVVSRYI